MANVLWTEQEWAEVAERAAELMVHSHYNQLNAINQAASEMPEGRQRRFTAVDWSIGSMARFKKMLEEAKSRAFNQKRVIISPPPKDIPKPVPATPQPTPAPQAAPKNPLDLSLEDLASAFLVKFLSSDKGQAVLAAAISAYTNSTPAPAQALVSATYAAARKPKVLVVGLRGDLADVVKQEFGDRADLRFLDAAQNPTRVKEQAQGVDFAFGMISFISHSVGKMLQVSCPRYTRINGTTGELRRVLSATLGH